MIKRLFAKLHARLSRCDGETLVETLVSTLIIAGVMLMLCTAIVSAAKINATARGVNVAYDESAAESVAVTVSVQHSGNTDTYNNSSGPISIVGYTQNGYVSYEASK